MPKLYGLLCIFIGFWCSSAPAQIPPGLDFKLIASGFIQPVGIRHAGDGSKRLFIVTKPGLIFIYDQMSEITLKTPFLDITALVAADTSLNGEQGLLGLAFHPDYKTNGFFFVNYTRDPGPGNNRTVIARYRVSDNDPNSADPDSATTLLEIEQPFGNHNGGDLHFGPHDAYLYIATGDGGSREDPRNNSQTLSTLLGKILRIDVDNDNPPPASSSCRLAAANYAVPASNPLLNTAGSCPEIWNFGLRNPWRFSFDRVSHDLFIGDVGQDAIEEINFQPAASRGGENYGWSCKEGNNSPNYNDCLPGDLVAPILTYTHAQGCSVTGGYRYRGRYQALVGTYIYADYCSGIIWFASPDPDQNWSAVQWRDTELQISSFGEDEAGELYWVHQKENIGIVYRLETPVSAGNSIYQHHFERQPAN